MKKILKFIFSKETVFVAFLFAGFFKDAISTGFVDLTIFFMFLSMLLAFWDLLKEKQIPRFRAEPIILFSLLALWVGISIFFTVNPIGYDKGLRFMVIAGWSFVGAVLIIKDKESLKKFFLGLILLGIISTAFAIKEYFSPNRPVGSVMVFGSDYLALGRIVSTSAIVLICSLVLKRMQFMTRIIGYVIFFSMLLAIVLSGARGPLLFLVLFIFLFIICVFRFSKGYLFFFTMIFIAILFILNQRDLSVFDTLAVRISHAVNEQGGGDSIAGRVDRFDTALNMISNRPITGYGIDGFTQIYNDGRLEYPHNIFLEIASELGLVGIFLFVILVFVALFRYFTQLNKIQNGEEKILAWTLFLLFIYYFANANVSGSLLGNRVLFTLIALLTVFKGFVSQKVKKEIS